MTNKEPKLFPLLFTNDWLEKKIKTDPDIDADITSREDRMMIIIPPTPYPTGFMWWFRNGDSWHAPDINQANDGPQPYQPNIKNQLLRDFLWFCRNPVGNFMGFVIGVEGRGYTIYGRYGALTTLYDLNPRGYGWIFAVLNSGWLWLPFVSYSGQRFLWYWGWRPYSGGFGFKFNVHGNK